MLHCCVPRTFTRGDSKSKRYAQSSPNSFTSKLSDNVYQIKIIFACKRYHRAGGCGGLGDCYSVGTSCTFACAQCPRRQSRRHHPSHIWRFNYNSRPTALSRWLNVKSKRSGDINLSYGWLYIYLIIIIFVTDIHWTIIIFPMITFACYEYNHYAKPRASFKYCGFHFHTVFSLNSSI